LSADSAKQLAEYSRLVGMKALHSVNRRAAELQKRDEGQADAVHCINFGVYNYSEMEVSNETPTN
jgi:hypothetical protein